MGRKRQRTCTVIRASSFGRSHKTDPNAKDTVQRKTKVWCFFGVAVRGPDKAVIASLDCVRECGRGGPRMLNVPDHPGETWGPLACYLLIHL